MAAAVRQRKEEISGNSHRFQRLSQKQRFSLLCVQPNCTSIHDGKRSHKQAKLKELGIRRQPNHTRMFERPSPFKTQTRTRHRGRLTRYAEPVFHLSCRYVSACSVHRWPSRSGKLDCGQPLFCPLTTGHSAAPLLPDQGVFHWTTTSPLKQKRSFIALIFVKKEGVPMNSS